MVWSYFYRNILVISDSGLLLLRYVKHEITRYLNHMILSNTQWYGILFFMHYLACKQAHGPPGMLSGHQNRFFFLDLFGGRLNAYSNVARTGGWALRLNMRELLTLNLARAVLLKICHRIGVARLPEKIGEPIDITSWIPVTYLAIGLCLNSIHRIYKSNIFFARLIFYKTILCVDRRSHS